MSGPTVVGCCVIGCEWKMTWSNSVQNKLNYKEHLVCSHYRVEIDAMILKEQKDKNKMTHFNECPEEDCGYIGPAIAELRKHVGLTHNWLEYIVNNDAKVSMSEVQKLKLFNKKADRLVCHQKCVECNCMIVDKHFDDHTVFAHKYREMWNMIKQEQEANNLDEKNCPRCGKTFSQVKSFNILLLKHFVRIHQPLRWIGNSHALVDQTKQENDSLAIEPTCPFAVDNEACLNVTFGLTKTNGKIPWKLLKEHMLKHCNPIEEVVFIQGVLRTNSLSRIANADLMCAICFQSFDSSMANSHHTIEKHVSEFVWGLLMRRAPEAPLIEFLRNMMSQKSKYFKLLDWCRQYEYYIEPTRSESIVVKPELTFSYSADEDNYPLMDRPGSSSALDALVNNLIQNDSGAKQGSGSRSQAIGSDMGNVEVVTLDESDEDEASSSQLENTSSVGKSDPFNTSMGEEKQTGLSPKNMLPKIVSKRGNARSGHHFASNGMNETDSKKRRRSTSEDSKPLVNIHDSGVLMKQESKIMETIVSKDQTEATIFCHLCNEGVKVKSDFSEIAAASADHGSKTKHLRYYRVLEAGKRLGFNLVKFNSPRSDIRNLLKKFRNIWTDRFLSQLYILHRLSGMNEETFSIVLDEAENLLKSH